MVTFLGIRIGLSNYAIELFNTKSAIYIFIFVKIDYRLL
jgi:hypothetical protein